MKYTFFKASKKKSLSIREEEFLEIRHVKKYFSKPS